MRFQLAIHYLWRLGLGCMFLCLASQSQAQKQYADSIYRVLQTHIPDSERVTALWDMGYVMLSYQPDSAMYYAYKGLQLARKIKNVKGESRSLGCMANIFTKMGNYPKALAYHLEALKIEEKRDAPQDLLSIRINQGIVYAYLGDFRSALDAYHTADSIASHHKITDQKYTLLLNLGDAYDQLGVYDSAFYCFQQSLQIATSTQDTARIGKSLLGLGNVFYKTSRLDSALNSYQTSIVYLNIANDEDLFCEASLGLAKVFSKINLSDSVSKYAKLSLQYAVEDGFLSREFEANKFLSDYYANIHQMDSAYVYLKASNKLKDSLESKDKVRTIEQITFNENIRQIELAEKAAKEKEERSQQLQLIFIAMFIPALFFVTVLLSRIRIPVKLIRFLGIISLLFLFEYLTLLLHPRVVEWTHHTPILEILIFVALAGFLIPIHHKLEHWMIERLVKRVQAHQEEKTKIVSQVATRLIHKNELNAKHKSKK